MKVIHVVNHFHPCVGGMEEVVKAITKELVKEGVEVKVICLNKCSKGKEKLPAKDEWNGVQIERIPFIDLKFYKIAPSVLWKIRDADIVHVHGLGFFSDYLVKNKLLHGKKIVLHTHGGVFHTKRISFFKKIYFYTIERIMHKFLDKVFAVSVQDKNLFSKICDKKKIVLLENGVNVEEFKVGKKTPNSFLYAGRLSKNKRIDLLLEAFARVVQKSPNAKLVIAGVDWENLQRELKLQAKELGISKNVSFLGEVNRAELLKQYSSAEFFVSASEYEGFGITALEASASECIPLVNKIDAFENIFGKESYLLIDFFNSEKASEQILEIMRFSESQKKNIKKQCKEIAFENDWKKKVKKLIEEYKKLC